MATVRSLLAKWLGGAGTRRPAGVRSLLARWIGGSGTSGLGQGGGQFGGSADVARTRSYEASGGAVFGGTATVSHSRGAQSVIVVYPAVPATSVQNDRDKVKKLVEEVYHIEIDDATADSI